MDVVVAPLRAPPQGAIGASDTWVLAQVCLAPALCLQVVTRIKKSSWMPGQHVSPSCLHGEAWWICEPGCVGVAHAASSR